MTGLTGEPEKSEFLYEAMLVSPVCSTDPVCNLFPTGLAPPHTISHALHEK